MSVSAIIVGIIAVLALPFSINSATYAAHQDTTEKSATVKIGMFLDMAGSVGIVGSLIWLPFCIYSGAGITPLVIGIAISLATKRIGVAIVRRCCK